MDLSQIIAWIGGVSSILGIIGFIANFLRNIKNDIRDFRKDFDDRFDKMEQKWIETNKRIDISNQRMDGVYHILLKRIKEE